MYEQISAKSFNASFRARTLATVVIALGMAFAANLAFGCANPLVAKQGGVRMLPGFAQAYQESQTGSNSIAGLWHVSYTSGGQPFYDALDQWHGDGTEFENADVAPGGGNICLGVWKQDAHGNVKLNHIGWTFDSDGNGSGYFTLTETNRVGKNGKTYQGHFDYKQYDVNGKLLGEATGTQKATRITVK